MEIIVLGFSQVFVIRLILIQATIKFSSLTCLLR